MGFDLLEDERLVLLPVKYFTSGYVLRPVTPIEDKDRDGRLVVSERIEEVPLEIAIVDAVAAVAFASSWACRGKIKRLDTSQRWGIVRSLISLFSDDIFVPCFNNLAKG